MSEEFRNLVLELRQEFMRQRTHNQQSIEEQGKQLRKEISFLKRELQRLKTEILAWVIGIILVQGILLIVALQALNTIAE